MPKSAPWKETGQYKRLTVTINLGEVDNHEDYNLKELYINVKASYLILGRETGKEGRRHFQGYMEFDKKRYGKAIDKAFRKTFPLPLSVHYEVPYSTPEKNIAYCSKEDSEPFTKGKPKLDKDKSKGGLDNGGGHRNDHKQALDMIEAGAPILEVARALPSTFLQYGRGLASFKAMITPKRSAPSQLIFLWGPTGTGKTMHAHELDPTTVSWTGSFLNGFYGHEDVILFDDFNYKTMDWQLFLTICDRYPLVINVKGGFANFAPKTIVFTSNSNPKDWYPEVPSETRDAIHRRMDEFGESRYLGMLVPKEQNILTKFLIKKPRVEEPVCAAPSSPDTRMREEYLEDAMYAAGGPPTEIIDIGSESEDEKEEERDSPFPSRKGLFQHDALIDG